MIRETGKPVEGHVEADAEEGAFSALGENGIVTESLVPDPRPQPGGGLLGPGPQSQYADALDSALDSASTQIPFDALTDRYRGKSVWVIDRDKIRRRVAQVVDAAIASSLKDSVNETETRERVAQAIEGLFRDNRNLTSQANQVAQQSAASALPSLTAAAMSTPQLEKQIDRLANFITRAEGVLASMSAAIRNMSLRGGGGGYAPRRAGRAEERGEQNAVLAEIFKANVDLLSALEGGPAAVPGAITVEEPAGAPAASASGGGGGSSAGNGGGGPGGASSSDGADGGPPIAPDPAPRG
jgi:hypothetical protein